MKPFGNGSRFRRAATWLAGSAFALLLATPLPSYAAPSALAINCDAISLRNAITTANSAGPGATIELPTNCVFTLPDGLYDGPGPTGLPVITGDVTLVGNGSTIQRDPAATTNFRLFWISNGAKLQLSNIALKNGLARGGNGGSTNNASGGGGGGIGLAGGNSLGKAGGGGGSFGAGGNGDATNGGAGGVGVRNGGQAGTGTSSGVGNNGGGGATRGRGGAGGFGGGGGGGTGGSVGGPGGTGGFGAGGGGGGGAFGFFLGSGAAGFGGGNGGAGTGNAIGGGGGGGGGLGGAIFIENGGALRLANTTLDGNQAVGGNGGSGTPTTSGAGGNGGSGYGGAIFNAGTYCDANGNTFVNNAVVAGTGGLGEVNGSNGSIGGQNIYHYSGFGQGLTSCTAFLAPEINVLGNGTSIVSGATTPSTADQSDFGSVSISNRIVVRTFTIQNTGTAALTVSTPTLSGTNAGDFAVTSLPASSVAVGGSTTFQITFDPTAVGTRTATVSIGNNDSNENPYTFALQGVGTLPTPNLSIPNGQRDAAQGSFSVPVNFASDGASIASLAFSLDYDENCLSFDGADANNDGIPDALTGLPSGFVASISYNANDTTGELDISLFDSSVPIGALSDGALFTVAFNVKPACVTTDGSLRNVTVNFSNTPAPSFSDATAKDVNGTSSGATIPLHFNAAPTALNLSNSSVAENAASGTTVGTLSTVDPDAGDTHTYALVTGTGDTDNASFTLANGVLKTAAVFDFETKSSYSVRIRTTDNGGLNGTFEQSFTINVTNVNEVPTVLSLDHTNVDENLPAGTTVGTFSTTDPDAGDSHTYALVTGTGDMDNASFTLANGVLKTAASFNYESKASYSIRVRTTDSGNLWLEQTFTINVNNVNDAPVAVNDPNDPTATIFVAGQATVIDVLANDTDEDHNPLSVSSLDTAGMQGSVTNNTSNVSYTAPEANGSSSFTYQASDGLLTSNSATVNVTYVKNDLRGDCNANGAVSAADFVATVLEIFDTNDTTYNNHPAWWLTYTGDYAGSPRGCDANASQNGPNYTTDSVGAGDLICTVLIFFREPCGSNQVVAADAAVPAQINVVAAEVQPGQIARVTVNLDPANHSVAAAAFALQIDPTKLGFDPADADGDGIPDAVVLNIPANMSKSVQWNAAHNRLEVAVFGTTLPLPTLNNGALATVNFQVAASATSGTTEVGLQLVSLGDTAGQDVAVEQSNGTVNITGQAASTLLYLPVIVR